MTAHPLDRLPVTANDPGLTDHERLIVRNIAARLHGVPAVCQMTHPDPALRAAADEAERRFLTEPTPENEQLLFRAAMALAGFV